MKKDKQISSLAVEMIAGLSEFCEALEEGIALEDRFTVRTVTLDLTPRSYKGNDVKALRERLKASQAIFAKFLGVSVSAVRAWELDSRDVPVIACRFMDEIVAYPELWVRRMKGGGERNST